MIDRRNNPLSEAFRIQRAYFTVTTARQQQNESKFAAVRVSFECADRQHRRQDALGRQEDQTMRDPGTGLPTERDI